MIIKFEDLERAKDNKIFAKYEKEIKELETKNLVKVDLKIQKISNSISISGKINGWMELVCDRCLNTFKYDLDIDIDERISLIPLYDYSNKEIKLKDGQLDEELLDTDNIDLDNFIYQSVTLNLPNKIVCGINCNMESEKIEQEFIPDSRLEIFNRLKKDK